MADSTDARVAGRALPRPFWILGILLSLLAAPVPGAETPELTLENAVTEALQNNPQLRLLEAHVETAGRQATAAGIYPFNPELDYEEALERLVGISQVVEWPGKRALREAIARRDAAAAEVTLRGFRVALAAEVREEFYQLLAARKLLELRKRELDAGEEILSVSRHRVTAGYAPVTERTSAEASVVRSRRDLREAEQAAQQARAALNALLGRDAGAALALGGELEPPPADVGLSKLVRAALERHPDLKAGRLELEKKELGSKLARKERMPDPTIGPLYSQDTQDTSDHKVGVGVTVPLPLWNRGGPQIALAEAERREAAAALEATRREVLANLEKAHEAFVAARDELSLYSPRLLTELEGELGATRERYAAGELSYLVLREAQRSYFDHVRDYYEALAGAGSAWAELEKAAGVSLEEVR